MMDDPLYREIILDHWQHPRHVGSLDRPDFSARQSNPTCGDTIVLTGTFEKDMIKNIAYRADGCALSVAAASLLSDFAIAQPISKLLKLAPQILLTELGLEISPARLNCALLPFETLKTALQKL